MLDLRMTSGLARLLAALLPALGGGDALAGAVATMALEVVTVLANPTVCLHPQQPAALRASQECPQKSEVSTSQLCIAAEQSWDLWTSCAGCCAAATRPD